METAEVPKKPVSRLAMYRNKIMIGLATAGAAAAPVSAADLDLNTTIGPILDGVIELIPTIISLIVAAIPAIVVLSVVAFIVNFLDQILVMMKLGK